MTGTIFQPQRMESPTAGDYSAMLLFDPAIITKNIEDLKKIKCVSVNILLTKLYILCFSDLDTVRDEGLTSSSHS